MHPRLTLSFIAAVAFGLSAAVGYSLILTNPSQIGPVGVTVWFVALLAALSGALCVALYFLKSFLKSHESRQTQLAYSFRQGLLLGGGLTVVLALQSLRQLAFRDVVLLAILLLLIEFYFRTKR